MKKLKTWLLPLLSAIIALLSGYGGAEINRAMPLQSITAPDQPATLAAVPEPGRIFHATLQVIWSRKTPGIAGEDQMISTETVKMTTTPNIGGFMAVLSKNIAGGRQTPCAPCDIVGPYGELTWYSTGKPIPEGGQKPTPETKDPPITE